jgi:hypothetical protein
LSFLVYAALWANPQLWSVVAVRADHVAFWTLPNLKEVFNV